MIKLKESNINEYQVFKHGRESSRRMTNSPIVLNDTQDIELTVLNNLILFPFEDVLCPHTFSDSIALEYNVMLDLSRQVYHGNDFMIVCEKIAQHLQDCSTHPSIKDGYVFISKVSGIQLNNSLYQGLSIAKYDETEKYLIVPEAEDNWNQPHIEKCLGRKKPDKGCLIVFDNEPFTVYVIDNGNAGTDYWVKNFLSCTPLLEDNFRTIRSMGLAKSFIVDELPIYFDIARADQIDLLNRSMKFFKEHDNFCIEEFAKDVMQQSEVIDQFTQYRTSYEDTHGIDLSDDFSISAPAVRKQARAFKSILKLDKNFDIYIHGGREKIEQGVDENGRKYYKIFYEEEH